MTNFIIRRIGQTAVTMLLLSFVCYYLMTLMPGDPIDLMASANPKITAEDIERLRTLYGLDKPVYERYINWMGTILQGDLGFSRQYKIPVTEILGPRLLNTFYLSAAALFLSLIIAIPLGVFAAVKKGSRLDYLANFGAFVGISIPSFWLAIVLIIVFAVWLGWFPAGGTYTVGQEGEMSLFETITDRAKYLVLPILSLTALQLGTFVRYARSSMVESMQADFIRTARAKGLSRINVIVNHGFRNALIPIITVIAISLSFIFSGAIITETVFAYQGVGNLVYSSIIANDFNVAMIAFMISVGMVLIMNLVADIVYGIVDPRIAYA